MTEHKILNPVYYTAEGWCIGMYDDGTPLPHVRLDGLASLLIQCNQHFSNNNVISRGSAIHIEDIPRPEPLPTLYLCRNRHGAYRVNLLDDEDPQIVAIVTFDADDNATVVRHDV